jgi:hypothetical protein
MKTPAYLPDDELIQKALTALTQALGPVETMRFLTLPRPQRLESVKRHQQWQETLQPTPFFDQVFGLSSTGQNK